MSENIYIYRTSPNQKSVITKKTVSGAGAPYGICNVAAVLNAAKRLSDRAFKLYIRMNIHQDGHTYALSPAEILQSIGMSDKRYRDAVNELIEKGFLVQTEKSKSVYYFYELPTASTDAPAKREDAPAKSNDAPAKPGVSSGEMGEMPRLFWEDNPAISGGEIVHNITSHNTVYNTFNNTNHSTMDNSCLTDGNCKECIYQDDCKSYNGDDLPF